MNSLDDTLEPLDPDQVKAIRRLERALKACRDANVEIRGQGNILVAYNPRKWDDVNAGGREMGGEPIPTYDVNDHGVYIDSGADDMLHGTLTRRGEQAMKEKTEEDDETEEA